MATASQTPLDPPLSSFASPAVYRFSVDEFERIASSLDDDHVELIDGRIIGRSEMKPAHALAAELTKASLQPLIPACWHLREEKPVRIPESSEPRPDFSVARGGPRDYASRHPGPVDVSLLVEIGDANLGHARGEKLRIYAVGRIAVYWIVNFVDRRLEIYSDPNAGEYSRRDYLPGERAPVMLDGTEVGAIDPADILP
jgi:Uma2 family endonuclease